MALKYDFFHGVAQEDSLGFHLGGGKGHEIRHEFIVSVVTPDSPAYGILEPGDEITAVNGRYVEQGSLDDLHNLMQVRDLFCMSFGKALLSLMIFIVAL